MEKSANLPNAHPSSNPETSSQFEMIQQQQQHYRHTEIPANLMEDTVAVFAPEGSPENTLVQGQSHSTLTTPASGYQQARTIVPSDQAASSRSPAVTTAGLVPSSSASTVTSQAPTNQAADSTIGTASSAVSSPPVSTCSSVMSTYESKSSSPVNGSGDHSSLSTIASASSTVNEAANTLATITGSSTTSVDSGASQPAVSVPVSAPVPVTASASVPLPAATSVIIPASGSNSSSSSSASTTLTSEVISIPQILCYSLISNHCRKICSLCNEPFPNL